MIDKVERTEGDMDLMDVRTRLNKFREMKDGWLDGEGVAPSDEGLTWLADAFERLYPAGAPLPFTFPMPSGGVQFEWSFNEYEVSLEVNLADHQGVWHVLNTAMIQREDEEVYLDLEDVAKWRWIGDELERMRTVEAVDAI